MLGRLKPEVTYAAAQAEITGISERPDESPIGRRCRFGDAFPWMTVVGVVADTRQWGIEVPARPEAYVVHGASPFQAELQFLLSGRRPTRGRSWAPSATRLPR